MPTLIVWGIIYAKRIVLLRVLMIKTYGDSVNKSEWSEMCLFEVERHKSEDVNLEVNFWLFKNIGEEKIGENQ